MLSQVTCPHCGREFHITADDYKNSPETKYCYCVFCTREFGVLEGKPWPPLEGGKPQLGHGAMM
jgi:hypothetical protein